MESFTCPHCGSTHEGHPTDRGWTLPDEVWAIPEAERKAKAKYTTDLCQFGNRYFIRCLIQLPFKDRPGYFGWGVWAEVDWPTFQKYLEVYEKDASNEPRVMGRLANQPPGYENLLNEEVQLQFGTATERPSIWFPENSQQKMAKEQRAGIDSARYHEILEATGTI
jgi:hypothetical protein